MGARAQRAGQLYSVHGMAAATDVQQTVAQMERSIACPFASDMADARVKSMAATKALLAGSAVGMAVERSA